MTIEKKIAQYIEKQFPSFYQEEGPQFIAFVKAYYDWLEEPGNVNHKARHLLEYRDIDTTMDEFLLYFKEKYLKNIQFDTATNKQLLVKNSLDLYRSKGTDRSVDLFFKLVFGTPAEVQYPGERIFKLSDGVWEVPKYLEVTYNKHNINYVGKQVIGSSSGATAFVEKYIRRRAGYGYVNMFYISGMVGTFTRGDVLGIKTNGAASYTPGQTATIIGSIDSVILQDNGMDFAVGDIVTFENSDRGVGGQARVTEIGEATGLIDFILHEGGWGYTTNATSIVSEKVATANGVYNTVGERPFEFMDTVYQPVLEMEFTAGPTLVVGDIVRRYNGANLVANGQVIAVDQTVGSNTGNATISVYKGPFIEGTLYVNANVATLNATSLVANVIGAEIMGVPNRYQLTVGSATGTFTVGMNVFQRNTEAIYGYGTVASVTPDTLVISGTVGAFSNGQSLQVDSNSSINATVLSVDTTIGLHDISIRRNTFTFTGSNNTTIAESEYVYQYNAAANAIAIGLALHTTVSSNAGAITFLPIRGYFSATQGPVYTSGNTARCTLGTLSDFPLGGDFYEASNAHWIAAYSNTHFTVATLSEGTGAEFDVGTIGETEVLYLNTDLLSAEGINRIDRDRYNLTAANTGLTVGDTVYQMVGSNTVVGTIYNMTATVVRVRDVDGTFVPTLGANGNLILLTNTAVNTSITSSAAVSVQTNRTGIPYMGEYIRASSMGWPKNPQGDYKSIIFDCLTFAQFTVGTIDSLTGLDPGSGYNVDPYVLVEQREIAAFGKHDYIASISNTNGSFVVGEKVSQSIANLTTYSLTVDHGVYTPAIEPLTIIANSTRDVNVTTDFIFTQVANIQFTPGRDVNYWTGAIEDGNADLFTANDYCIYATTSGNTGVITNNSIVSITSANDTHIIVNTAITLSAQTFNPSTIVNNFISISSNPYANTTLLKYWVSSSNSEVFGLEDGEEYYAVEANSTGLKLSLTSGGSVVDITAGVNETGHALVLQNTASSGHFIYLYSNDLPDGAMVRYQTTNGNTVIGGLTNNTVYYVKSSNAVGYKLAATKAGSAVDLTSVADQAGQVFISLQGWQPLDAVYSNSGAYGIIDSVAANTVVVKSVSNGTFAAPGTITSNTYSYLTANVSASDLEEVVRTAEALVKTANNSTLLLKRIQFTNLFDTSVTLTGETSGANAILTAISEDTSSLPIGLNANVEANVITADGTVTALKIIDSGYGYTNSEIIQFTSVDGSRAGSAKVVLGGSGKGIGYYKSSKGFLSDSVCIHDGDYYQEYSYEIFSKLSLDRYHDMFKKVMHTAGTKFFGSARVVEEDAVVVSLAESSVTSE